MNELFNRVEKKYGMIAALFCAIVSGFSVVAITLLCFMAFMFVTMNFPWALLSLPATAAYMIWSVWNE